MIVPFRFFSFFLFFVLDLISPLVPHFLSIRKTTDLHNYFFPFFYSLLLKEREKQREPTIKIFIFVFRNDRKIGFSKQIAIKCPLESMNAHCFFYYPLYSGFSAKSLIRGQRMMKLPNLLGLERRVIFSKLNSKVLLFFCFGQLIVKGMRRNRANKGSV